jgi:hypothetical protein
MNTRIKQRDLNNTQIEYTKNSLPHVTKSNKGPVDLNNLTFDQLKLLIIFSYLSKVKEIKKTEVKKVNLIKEFIPYINDLSLTEKSIFDSIYSYLKLSKKDYFKVSEKYLKQIQGGFFDQNEKIEQNEKIKKPKLIVRLFKAIVNQFIDKQSFINRIITLFSN